MVYEPAAAIYHIYEESWPQVRRRYYREAVAGHQIGIKNRGHILPEMIREGRDFVADIFRVAIADVGHSNIQNRTGGK